MWRCMYELFTYFSYWQTPYKETFNILIFFFMRVGFLITLNLRSVFFSRKNDKLEVLKVVCFTFFPFFPSLKVQEDRFCQFFKVTFTTFNTFTTDCDEGS